MPILREAFALVFWVALETQHNAFLNSASHSLWVVRQVALWGWL
ncbi:hypothetical protein [Leptospira noguchii]|nr:hypothetical protein [Leptospira noguchii]